MADIKEIMRFDWQYGENENQKYYDVTIGSDYMYVFCNKWQPDIWMSCINNQMIWNKRRNDYQRKKQGLPKGCCQSLLSCSTLLCSSDPFYLMKKTERCYLTGKREITP